MECSLWIGVSFSLAESSKRHIAAHFAASIRMVLGTNHDADGSFCGSIPVSAIQEQAML